MHMSKLCIRACAHNIPTIINQWEEDVLSAGDRNLDKALLELPMLATTAPVACNVLCPGKQWLLSRIPGKNLGLLALLAVFETPRPFSTPTLRWWGEAAWQRARWTATGPRFDWGAILVHAMPCCRTPWKARLNRLALYGSFYIFSWIVCLKQTCSQAESLLSLNTSNYPQNPHYTSINIPSMTFGIARQRRVSICFGKQTVFTRNLHWCPASASASWRFSFSLRHYHKNFVERDTISLLLQMPAA